MFPYNYLDVYKKSKEVNKRVYLFLRNNNTLPFFIKNQMGRASLSILLNIAEGTSRMSPRDRRRFFEIARGSSFECSALAEVLFELSDIPQDLQDYLMQSYEEISRMLLSLMKKLEK